MKTPIWNDIWILAILHETPARSLKEIHSSLALLELRMAYVNSRMQTLIKQNYVAKTIRCRLPLTFEYSLTARGESHFVHHKTLLQTLFFPGPSSVSPKADPEVVSASLPLYNEEDRKELEEALFDVVACDLYDYNVAESVHPTLVNLAHRLVTAVRHTLQIEF